MPGHGQIWLKQAGYGWKMNRNALNSWKYMDVTENGCTCLEWLKMAINNENGWTFSKFEWNDFTWL